MYHLSHEQVIEQLNELLGEDITSSFEKQLQIAGEHGYPSFSVKSSNGEEIQVMVEWDKEADTLCYAIQSEHS